MRRPAAALLAALAVPARGAAQAPATVWATDSAAPCVGLTVGWRVDAAKLRPLVGGLGPVAAGPDGRGIVLLFVTTCPGSTIGGRATGPVALGAVIVPLAAPRDTSGAPPTSAIPEGYGADSAAVTALFRRYGYAVATSDVKIAAESAGAERRAAFAVVTRDGVVRAEAQFGDSASRFAVRSAIAAPGAGGEDGGLRGIFRGPEWAERRRGRATVTTLGVTIVSRLGLPPTPDFATWDEGFGWRFAFSRR